MDCALCKRLYFPPSLSPLSLSGRIRYRRFSLDREPPRPRFHLARQLRSQRGRQKQSGARSRPVSRTNNARLGVMCGHVNWRVIDEQITWRSIRQRMLGTSAYRAHQRDEEREGERGGGVRRKKIATFLVLADIRARALLPPPSPPPSSPPLPSPPPPR